MKLYIRSLFFLFFLCAASLVPQSAYSATAIDKSCQRVEAVFARGSGQDPSDDENDRFVVQLEARIQKNDMLMNHYELGTESYGGKMYEPVDVANPWNGNAAGAYVSAGQGFAYGDSVLKGKTELKAYLEARMKKCGDALFLVGGYSQGAQVIREGVEQLTSAQKDRIVFMALFGDPKLYLPEGAGPIPPRCLSGDIKSSWRRDVPNCRTNSGSLQAQKPYLSSTFANKTGLWCNDNDFVCGSSRFVAENFGHFKYADSGQAIDSAAKEAAEKVQAKLPVDKAPYVDTKYKQGDKIAGHDMVFAIDLEYSMAGRLPQIKEYIRKSVAKLQQQGTGRFAIVVYGRSMPVIVIGMPPSGPQAFVYNSSFEDDPQQVLEGLNNIEAWGNMPGSPLHGIKTSLDTLNWRQGAAKSVILFTNKSTYESPDYEGITNNIVLKRALEIDPVSIFPVVPEEGKDAHQELADKSSGKVFVDSGEGEIKDEVFDTVTDRPIVVFGNSEYFAPLGQEITFDVSGSYALDSTITKYEWDFDGDLDFDATTTTPIASNTYATNGDRVVQVRVTAANGMIANGSTVVKIGPVVEPALPKAPLDLKVTTASNTAPAATLTWTPADQLTDSWAISVNGVVVGTISGDRTTIDITDLERGGDVTFGIAGVTAEKGVGDAASVVLAKPVITPPDPCNTGNFYNDLICRIKLSYNTFVQQINQWWLLFPS